MLDATIRGAPSAWRWPQIRARPALLFLGLFIGVSALQGVTVWVAIEAAGGHFPFSIKLLDHLAGAVGAWLALPCVQTAVLNAPGGPRVGWRRFLGLHLAGYVAFATIHIAAMLGLRLLILLPGEKAPSASSYFAYRILWEAQSDVILYAGLAAIWTLLRAWDERRTASLRAAKLEAQLASARLDALVAQLDPHFLFNALNTVSEVMYEDLPRTERLLSDLGELLRATLASGGVSWTLAEERAHTERYLDLLRARFDDRLEVRWQLDAGLEQVQVPRLALQSLVENAVKHNRDRTEPLTIRISVGAFEGMFCLAVQDDGRGFGPDAPVAEMNRGLGRLEETLRLLHGERARVERSLAEGGGARVVLRFPEEGT